MGIYTCSGGNRPGSWECLSGNSFGGSFFRTQGWQPDPVAEMGKEGTASGKPVGGFLDNQTSELERPVIRRKIILYKGCGSSRRNRKCHTLYCSGGRLESLCKWKSGSRGKWLEGTDGGFCWKVVKGRKEQAGSLCKESASYGCSQHLFCGNIASWPPDFSFAPGYNTDESGRTADYKWPYMDYLGFSRRRLVFTGKRIFQGGIWCSGYPQFQPSVRRTWLGGGMGERKAASASLGTDSLYGAASEISGENVL